MKKFDIWCEGYAATGERGRASLMGSVEANTFAEACVKFFERHEDKNLFDPAALTFWGCQLFDNPAAARASFG